MRPLWIIDLGQEATSAARLQELFSALTEDHRAHWHYTAVRHTPVNNPLECKSLMDLLVSEGRTCNNDFIKAGYSRENFQIAVLGAADEALTQSVFAPLPGLLRDAFPMIVADHSNLGIDISGFLFIPNTLNQEDDKAKRQKAALLLESVNLLTERLEGSHFSRVVAYQDVQNTAHLFYPGLSTEQRTELLFQMLVSQYYCSEKSDSVFDSLSSSGGVFSLGAASIHYDSVQHCRFALRGLVQKFLDTFKDKDLANSEYSRMHVKSLFESAPIDVDTVEKTLRVGCNSAEVDLRKMDAEADPHPVWDLFRSDLFPRYYRKFLKYMPARLLRFMQTLSYALLGKYSVIIRKNRKTFAETFCQMLKSRYRPIYKDEAAKYATIAQMESFFSEAKNWILEAKKDVQQVLLEIVPIPKYLRNDYDKCLADEEENKPSAILDKLKKNLKKEPVVLSLLVRCFLLGILLVFTIIPLMRVLSPNVINLGEIATIEWLWIPILFFLPLIIEFVIKLRRHFKRIKRLKYRLLAMTLLNVNKQLSAFLFEEKLALYDSVSAECDAQAERLSAFRDALSGEDESESAPAPLPITTFNQDILDGEFCGEKMILDPKVVEASIVVKENKVHLSQLRTGDITLLLKRSFLEEDVVKAADLSDDSPVEDHAKDFVAALEKLYKPKLSINTAADIGSMLQLLGKDIDLRPLQKMAGVSGMLFSTPVDGTPILRIKNVKAAPIFGNVRSSADDFIPDYAFLIHWKKLDNGFFAEAVCNCKLDPLPQLSFAEILTLYYAYYRRKDLAYTLAGMPIRISKEDMDKLDKQIIGG